MRQLISNLANHPLVPRRPVARQFIKFAMVGVVNTTIDLGVYSALVFGWDVHYLVANIFAFLTAASNSYILNRRWTFRSGDPRWRRQAIKYFIVLAIGFGLNETLLFLLVAHAGVGRLLAKCLAVIVVLFWNFGANRLWTFSSKAAPSFDKEG